MNKTKGYIVRLSKERENVLEHNEYETFGEPVAEFKHSRNIPLICFIVDSNSRISHLALGTRGNMAGTDMRRLNLNEIFILEKTVQPEQIQKLLPNRFKKKFQEKLKNGGLLSPKLFEALLKIICTLAPETTPILSKYSEARAKRIENLPQKIKETLAEQKEAVATALSIAGIDRKELQGWDLKEDGEVSSFLDGLEQVRLREDQMIINDLTNLPGYDVLKTTPFSSTIFENDQSKLTVILANRLPLEEQFGVDLIYYNETFSCFLMIQYKAMEKEAIDTTFRFPNKQLTEEIKRMNNILAELHKCPGNNEADGYRLNENPFFLKICPRIVFDPDNVGLIKGMYLPLDYWKSISQHPSLIGPKGGKRLTYNNVRRYFTNTDFINIASGGWVGTNIEQSKLLQTAIRSTLESGRAVVFAINKVKDLRHIENIN